MNGSSFKVIQYMNGSTFKAIQYMNWTTFKALQYIYIYIISDRLQHTEDYVTAPGTAHTNLRNPTPTHPQVRQPDAKHNRHQRMLLQLWLDNQAT